MEICAYCRKELKPHMLTELIGDLPFCVSCADKFWENQDRDEDLLQAMHDEAAYWEDR